MAENNFFIIKDNFVKEIILKKSEVKDLIFLIFTNGNKEILINAKLAEGAHINLHFLMLTMQNAQTKLNVKINHNGSNSFSDCNVKVVATNHSSNFINVDSIIKKNIKGFVANQSVDGLILDQAAIIEVAPNLLVNTNAGVCMHAVNLGNISQEKVFYLMTKGISKFQAIKMLVFSYFEIILYNIKDEKVKQTLSHYINDIYERNHHEKY